MVLVTLGSFATFWGQRLWRTEYASIEEAQKWNATRLQILTAGIACFGIINATFFFTTDPHLSSPHVSFGVPSTILAVQMGSVLAALILASNYFRLGAIGHFSIRSVKREIQFVFLSTMAVFGIFFSLSYVHDRSAEKLLTSEEFIKKNSRIFASVAQEYDLPESTLKSVFKVIHDHPTTLQLILEEALFHFGLSDDHGHLLMGLAYDVSVGPSQIKLTTAQSALLMLGKSHPKLYPTLSPRKTTRDAWMPTEDFVFDDVHFKAPPQVADASKDQVSAIILSDRGSIYMMGLILKAYQLQWLKMANIDLKDRPDILVTLYSRGFEQSKPHQNPQPNRLGNKAIFVANP
jgi:hypothetical protein